MRSELDSASRTKLVLHRYCKPFATTRSSWAHSLRRRRHLPDPCEPRLSPLRDDNDFILLRCDANCFHLVLPFLSIHLTGDELKTAIKALRGLWANGAREVKPSQPEPVAPQNV